jgi:hypothetical protein
MISLTLYAFLFCILNFNLAIVGGVGDGVNVGVTVGVGVRVDVGVGVGLDKNGKLSVLQAIIETSEVAATNIGIPRSLNLCIFILPMV